MQSSELLARVEAFLVKHPTMTATRLSIEATADREFVAGLRQGRKPLLDTAHQVLNFMRAYRKPRSR